MQTVSTLLRRLAPGSLLLCLLLLVPVPPAPAVEMDALYTVEVQLDPEQGDGREAAYREALRQILIRITGSEQAALSPELNELFPSPARYVLQFRSGENDTLVVSMDGEAIEELVRGTGYPVWGSDRPATLLWLAVDWGQGNRELITADDPDAEQSDARSINRDRLLRERVREVARQRGVPLMFPLLDTEDFSHIGFADVWGGFHEPLLEASRRYGANSILVGRLRPAEFQRNRWSFYFGGREEQWSGEPEEAIHRLADTLAGQLAVAGNAPLQAITLAVTGVDSVAAYGEVQRTIAGLSAVERYSVQSVAGDRIRYRVEIPGGAGRLGSELEFSGKLKRAGVAPAPAGGPAEREPADLEYVYRR